MGVDVSFIADSGEVLYGRTMRQPDGRTVVTDEDGRVHEVPKSRMRLTPAGTLSEVHSDSYGASYRTPAGHPQPRYYLGCGFCTDRRAVGDRHFPPHVASEMCQSGRSAHCSCDWCF